MQQQNELIIRPGDITTDDYDIFASLLNAVNMTSISGDIIRGWDKNNKLEDDLNLRYAACVDDSVIGYGIVYYPAILEKPRLTVWLTIDEAYRGQGFGSQFYDFLANKALEHGATEFSSDCSANDAISLTFAEKKGFSIRRHYFKNTLDLETFDPEPLLPVVEEVKAQGIRFSSLAEEGNTEEAQYKLFQLNATTAHDNPSSDGTYKETFENFKSKIVNAHWFRAEGQLLAIDEERYVGLGAVGIENDGITAYNAFTGVDKDYRGRKIAQALKVLGAQLAKEWGMTKIVTDNDSQNAPMLAVNRKLGYQRTPGMYLLIKTI